MRSLDVCRLRGGKTKTSMNAGLCSTNVASGGLDESLIEHSLPLATIEFLQSIAYPQRKALARLSSS